MNLIGAWCVVGSAWFGLSHSESSLIAPEKSAELFSNEVRHA
jgi:hypothetical protein